MNQINQNTICYIPKLKKQLDISHAVKIGNYIKISGAVSMDDEGNQQ